ncbi:MAG: Imidazoleglycerol-phosphate dehydratase, partial [uncultured Blastococcus sp.]
EPHCTRRAGDQRDQAGRRAGPRRHRDQLHQHRCRLLRPHAHRAVQAQRHRPLRPGRRRPAHRRPPHRRGRRHRPGAGLRAGPRRQARHHPLRRRDDPDGRGARPGGGRPLRPAVLRARRAREHDADDRPGLPHQPDRARAGVLRLQRADQPARAGPLRRPRRPPHRRGPVQGARPGAAPGGGHRPPDHRRAVDQGRPV